MLLMISGIKKQIIAIYITIMNCVCLFPSDYAYALGGDMALEGDIQKSGILDYLFLNRYFLSIILLLSLLVCFLLLYIKRINAKRNAQLNSLSEITKAYNELEASGEELRQQYDEILENYEQSQKAEKKLIYLAYHDMLTGLPNRTSLLENANKHFSSHQDRINSLLFIDIDNFKYINDLIGHASADQLICKVSDRLTSLLKKDCYLYRSSGDEFIIILQNISGKDDAEVFAAHILAGFKEKFIISDSILQVSLSIGIAIHPTQGHDVEELLKFADNALYQAKGLGKNNYVVYDNLMKETFSERLIIEKHLNTALDKNEFELYYQPQLDLNENRIRGFEALLRWKSPELGFISPLTFIKIAEETRLIIPLGFWVMRCACAFLKDVHSKGYINLTISINISVLQIQQDDFINLVMDTLEFYGLNPCSVELEITETVLMESYDAIGPKLECLKKNGVRIALDDFGQGYSSFSNLRQLPISTIKIDKSFIDDIIDSEENSLAEHIVRMGRRMGMCVVAEGVESQEQMQYLKKHECDMIQGYFFSRPVPRDEAMKLIEAGE